MDFYKKWGIDFPLFLAPMAGVTDFTFRSICKRLGADVIVTEFVSADGILYENNRTKTYINFSDEQRPLGVQIFGADKERMALACEKLLTWKVPDFIDLNFGCPVKKVVCKNGGAAVLKDLKLLGEIAEYIVKCVGDVVPISAKIRLGWDDNSIVAEEACKVLENSGISFITIHGRTRRQAYSGKANWELISNCAEIVKVPVIGNGDISTVEDVMDKKENAGVSGLMIGRAAMTHPWIFQEAKTYLDSGVVSPPVLLKDKWTLIIDHANEFINNGHIKDEKYAISALRGKLMAYTKGFPDGRRLRSQLSKIVSLADLTKIKYNSLNEFG